MISLPNTKITLKQIQESNKGLFAAKTLSPWETVLEGKPLFSSESSMQQLHDYGRSVALVRIDQSSTGCQVLHYCSRECQKEDWKWHKDECPIYNTLREKKQISPDKITAEFGVNLRGWLARKKFPEVDDQFKQMISLLEFQPIEKVDEFKKLAVILIENLNIQQTEEILTDFIRQISAVSINGFTIQDYLCSMDSVGVGIYWPANYFNHNCHPNCVQIFDGSTLKVVARRKIEVGQQLSISYISQNKKLPERNKILRKQYLFECFCETCQIDRMFDWETFFLLCPRCHQKSLTRQSKIKKGQKLRDQFQNDNAQEQGGQKQEQSEMKSKKREDQKNEDKVTCNNCHEVISAQQVGCLKQKISSLAAKVCDPATSYAEGKKSYFQIKKMLHQSDPDHDLLLNNVYLACLEQASRQPQLYSQAFLLLKDLIEKMSMRFRVDLQSEAVPYTYVWKYAEMGKLAYNLSKKKKAWQFTEKAAEIIQKLAFKHKFTEVEELKERYHQLKISLSFEKAEINRR